MKQERACIASRTALFPRNEKEMLLRPPLVRAPGRFAFDPADRLDEIDRVIAVLLETGRNREHVRIENDVVRRDACALGQELVGARANVDPPLQAVGLPGFVERHHDHRRAVLPDERRLPQKFLLAVLQADRIHDRLALDAFQTGFDHAPLRAVDHDRHPRDFGLAPDQMEKARHRRFGIDHPFIHVDVENVGAALDLLARHGRSAVAVVAEDQFERGEPVMLVRSPTTRSPSRA